MKNKDKTGYKIAAFGFCISGLIYFLGAIMNGDVAMNVSIGTMNICIGMMFLSFSESVAKKRKTITRAKKTWPSVGSDFEI